MYATETHAAHSEHPKELKVLNIGYVKSNEKHLVYDCKRGANVHFQRIYVKKSFVISSK